MVSTKHSTTGLGTEHFFFQVIAVYKFDSEAACFGGELALIFGLAGHASKATNQGVLGEGELQRIRARDASTYPVQLQGSKLTQKP